ncbi:MAG: UbiA family prenyltransferase [Spirulinaceae cyanobacterium RM2_2_10]|nr:UbiA family prenyltransferase [Spirulinaceae cyanobacterium SM2_1_0]NJO20856.1 UbiA family prenyltransferase [Spirulinaceae cyanobacterium RM2_2_10]
MLGLKRWWIYQRERFPVLKHGLLVAVFSSAAVSHSALLRQAQPQPASLLVACAVIFCSFLQLRIADEFKDYAEDCRYRPYRPLPRGLIRRWELAGLGVLTLVLQLLLSLSLGVQLAIALSLVWLYLAAMSLEFGVPAWLKAHLAVYMLSHLAIVPLIAFYGMACDWLVAGDARPSGSLWFLLASAASGAVIEFGRKIRAPAAEEPGVETYSARWGRGRAVAVWMGALMLAAIAALGAASQIRALLLVAPLVILLVSIAGCLAWRFWQHPDRSPAGILETLAAIWTLTVYLSLGPLPVLLRAGFLGGF